MTHASLARCCAGLGAATAVYLLLAPAAFAGTTTINFDTFAAGTVLTTVGDATFVGGPAVFTPVHVATQSPPNALHATHPCGMPASSCSQEVDFSAPKSAVSLRIGLDDESAGEFPIPFQLTGYNSVGAVVAASDAGATLATGYDPITRLVSIQSLNTDITRVVLSVGTTSSIGYNSAYARRAAIDDLTFTDNVTPPPPAPTVTISAPTGGQRFVQPGDVRVSGSVSAPAGVSRFCLTTSTATTIPAACAGSGSLDGAGAFSNLTVPGLTPGTNRITAWIEDGTLRTASTSVTVNVDQVDLSANDLEINQGVQSQLPFLVRASSSASRTALYLGVPLAAGRPTVVRFWTGMSDTGGSATVGPVRALLYGVGDRGSLGPPLTPVEGPRSLDTAHSVARTGPTLAQWSDPSSQSYTFRLPPSWTRGQVTLRAVVNPPGSFPAVTECAGCDANNTITLENLGFVPVSEDTITPVEMITRGPGGTIDHPTPEWSGPHSVLPFGVAVRPYQGQIDISDGLAVPPGPGNTQRDARQALAMDKLFSWDDHNGSLVSGHLVAMSDGQDLGLTSTRLVCCSSHLGIDTLSQVTDERPLTSVMHEFGHELGLAHAGTHGPLPGDPAHDRACLGDSNGQVGTDWPPDQRGLLQGVGLDPRTGSGGSAGPFRVLGEVDGSGAPQQFFDFMSYCAGEGNGWISVRNWTQLLSSHANGHIAADLAARRNAATVIGGRPGRVPNHGPALRVTAIIGAQGLTRIFGVEPQTGFTIKPAGGSPVTLKVYDAHGRLTSSTPVPVTTGHIDRVEPFMAVDAVIRAPAGARLAMLYSGRVIARLAKPPHAPSVRLLSPRRGAKLRASGTTLIRWRVRDRARARLTASIDYAANGRSFRTLVTGVARTTYALPNALLTRSAHGRLRVRVSDGWNVAVASSGPLKVPGPAARGAIDEPLPGARVAADGTFVASGAAVDDRGRAVPGHEMRWFDGGRYLGRGTEITVHGMTPGSRRLRLVTFADGRRGVFSVPVRVRRVAPAFTLLRIAPGRRSLSITAATTVPGVLVLGAHRYAVGPDPRVFVVSLAPEHGRLRLALQLRTFTGTLRVVRTLRAR